MRILRYWDISTGQGIDDLMEMYVLEGLVELLAV